MPRESGRERSYRAVQVLDALEAALPQARIELDHRTPYELLVAVVLSAQCTDARVNQVTPALFRDFPHPAALAEATPARLEDYLKTLGLFRNKAKALVALGRVLVEQHAGEVPRSRAVLESLPGVGRKTAGVVSMHVGGDRAFPVDTHVTRLAGRLGLSGATSPDRIEEDLCRLLPPERWFQGHQVLIWHGRRVCHAANPECARCVVAPLCPKKGVSRPRRTRGRRPGRP